MQLQSLNFFEFLNIIECIANKYKPKKCFSVRTHRSQCIDAITMNMNFLNYKNKCFISFGLCRLKALQINVVFIEVVKSLFSCDFS